MNDIAIHERLVRSEYLGSSDAAAILGLSKWKTPLDVWRAKVFPDAVEDEAAADRSKILRRGKLMEPVIRQMAIDDYGLTLYATNRRHEDEDYPWMRAEVDFETLDEGGAVVNNECKSVSPFAASQWGDEDTDEVPIEYHAQVQFALMVTGAQVERCDVWALFGSDKLVRYRIYRDEETIAGMRARCVEFWHEHVLAKRAPAPVTLDDVEFLMGRKRGRPVIANPDQVDLVMQYRDAKHQIKQLEERAEELKLAIVGHLLAGAGDDLSEQDAAILLDGAGKPLLTWKPQSSSRIDVAALRKARPEVADEFTTISTSRVLRLAKA